MMILDPLGLMDARYGRAGPATYWNAAGTLQTAAANVLRYSYNPQDLAAPVAPLIEAAALNAIRNNSMQGAVVGAPGTLPAQWEKASNNGVSVQVLALGVEAGIDYIDVRLSGTTTAPGFSAVTFGAPATIAAASGQEWTLSAFVRVVGGSLLNVTGVNLCIDEYAVGSFVVGSSRPLTLPGAGDPANASLSAARHAYRRVLSGGATVASVHPHIKLFTTAVGQPVDITLRIGLPQMERGAMPTSPIRTSGTALARAADTMGEGSSALVASNVADAPYPARDPGLVYAAGDKVEDPATHLRYESKTGIRGVVALSLASPGVVTWAAHGLADGTPVSFATSGTLPAPLVAGTVYYVRSPSAGAFNLSATSGAAALAFSGTQSGVHTASAGQNLNRALTMTDYWLPLGAGNRWKMFDEYNNTQTENAEAIIVTLKPSAIAQGLYLGNVDAAEVVVTVTDPVAGVVHHEASSLQVGSHGSSFYRWLFGRRRRKNYFLTLALPLYYNALVTIEIRNPDGIARCGMCRLGPVEDIGFSQYGLGTDIKDYSTTRFNFDGTSETIERGFSKRMSIDVVLDNDTIDYVQEKLAASRQRTLVYIGATEFGSTVLCGKFSSFKNVIEGYTHSKMTLQIEGTV